MLADELSKLRKALVAAFVAITLLWASTFFCTIHTPLVSTMVGGFIVRNMPWGGVDMRMESTGHDQLVPFFWMPYSVSVSHAPSFRAHPLWMIEALVVAAIIAVEAWRRGVVARAVARGECPNCHHSLQGLGAKSMCPECGKKAA